MSPTLQDLPIELVGEILCHANIQDVARFITTCKLYHEKFEVKKINQLDLKFGETTNSYTSLNDLITTVAEDLKSFVPNWHEFYYPKEFHHFKLNRSIKLKFTKSHKTGRCTFIIRDEEHKYPYYLSIQVTYEPQYSRYRITVPKNRPPIQIPMILVFLGFKVLFAIHGYDYAQRFKDMSMHFEQPHDDIFPEWFQRLATFQEYNGAMYTALFNSYLLL